MTETVHDSTALCANTAEAKADNTNGANHFMRTIMTTVQYVVNGYRHKFMFTMPSEAGWLMPAENLDHRNPITDPNPGSGRLKIVIDGLLCDLDGTLLDSEPWHKASELEVFRDLGIDLTLEALHAFTGGTLNSMLAAVSQQTGRTVLREDFLARQIPILSAMIAHKMQPFPDAVPFLERFGALGSPKWVVTSSSQWYVSAVRERFPFLDRHFDGWICGDDVRAGKPDPEPYRLGKVRARCENPLIVEDSRAGVRAGIAAGGTVVGVDRHRERHLHEADVVVLNLNQILSKR